MEKTKQSKIPSFREIVEIEEEEDRMNDESQRVRAADTEIYYKKYFKKKLKLMTYALLKNMGEDADGSVSHSIAYSGALSFAYELRRWFEEQVSLSLSRFDKEEKPKPGESSFPNIEE